MRVQLSQKRFLAGPLNDLKQTKENRGLSQGVFVSLSLSHGFVLGHISSLLLASILKVTLSFSSVE